MGDISRRRPWLAVLLALVISGLGHAYLRRWARAFGWYVAITAIAVVFVPDSAVSGLLSGDPPPVRELAPGIVAVATSVVDAYVVAIRNNRKYDRRANATTTVDEQRSSRSAGAPRTEREEGGPTGEQRPVSTETTGETDEETVPCPSCGRESKPEFDFCRWCAEPLDE